jgi:predicted DNA binding CopG/RHH family protein
VEVDNQWEIKRLATPAAAHSIIKTMIASSNPQTEMLKLSADSESLPYQTLLSSSVHQTPFCGVIKYLRQIK